VLTREGGRVTQDVVHLGQHPTVEAALDSWAQEIEELMLTRPKQAQKLQEKLDRLRGLTKGANLTPT
jgi:hypothetical protein